MNIKIKRHTFSVQKMMMEIKNGKEVVDTVMVKSFIFIYFAL